MQFCFVRLSLSSDHNRSPPSRVCGANLNATKLVTQGRMTSRQKLESGKANRDLLQPCILIKQYVGRKKNMKLKSSLITVVSQVFLLSVWKSCITSNCVLHEITRMVSTLFAFLYKGCTLALTSFSIPWCIFQLPTWQDRLIRHLLRTWRLLILPFLHS